MGAECSGARTAWRLGRRTSGKLAATLSARNTRVLCSIALSGEVTQHRVFLVSAMFFSILRSMKRAAFRWVLHVWKEFQNRYCSLRLRMKSLVRDHSFTD